MKVWEYMNKLKGTSATLEQIKDWSYMNREAPCDFREPMNGMELDGGIPKSFEKFIGQWCTLINDCDKCYQEFFEIEIPDNEPMPYAQAEEHICCGDGCTCGDKEKVAELRDVHDMGRCD